jgi:hypothetical protein
MLRTTCAIAATAIALLATPAAAGERLGDAAMGALAGAVVLGPVGAVAGGVVGYVKGPDIAHGMGLKNHSRKPPAKVARD